jgi:hypothetical protein
MTPWISEQEVLVLLRSGISIRCTVDDGVEMTLGVAAGAMTRVELTGWLRART